MRPPTGPGDHVLLIGIDDYVHAPLAGCVNDIDAIQRVWREGRLAIPDHRPLTTTVPRQADFGSPGVRFGGHP